MTAKGPPRLPYTRVKRGVRFFEPTPPMKAKGFLARSLGPEGPAAWAKAAELYADWTKLRTETPKVTTWPPGSFGAYWDRYRRSRTFAKKMPRTREDYHRAWVHLGPAFGAKVITAITVEDVEHFLDDGAGGGLERRVSASERYRTIKVMRALYADAIARLQLKIKSPANAVRNPQPRGRTAIWLGAEITVLVATAKARGYHGMAMAIELAWDTMFSPVDIWTLERRWIREDGQGRYVERDRTKSGVGAFGALTEATAAALDDYIEALPFELAPDAPVIRQRNGHAYRSKDTFGDDFRAVRNLAFPGDKRQFLDIRRSANVEADAAGADKATMGELLANSMATSRFLSDTYTPPTVTKAREVHRQRVEGRAALAGELERVQKAGRRKG